MTDRLHERALCYLYIDQSFETVTLADRVGFSPVVRRIQNMLIYRIQSTKQLPTRVFKRPVQVKS